MSGLRTFSCVVVLCDAMVNVAMASPKIEARGQLGRDIRRRYWFNNGSGQRTVRSCDWGSAWSGNRR
ncbi:hypothetical protein HpBHB17_07440 [Helicobacter pylori]